MFYVLGTILRTVQSLSHLILTTTFLDRYYLYLFFKDENLRHREVEQFFFGQIANYRIGI